MTQQAVSKNSSKETLGPFEVFIWSLGALIILGAIVFIIPEGWWVAFRVDREHSALGLWVSVCFWVVACFAVIFMVSLPFVVIGSGVLSIVEIIEWRFGSTEVTPTDFWANLGDPQIRVVIDEVLLQAKNGAVLNSNHRAILADLLHGVSSSINRGEFQSEAHKAIVDDVLQAARVAEIHLPIQST